MVYSNKFVAVVVCGNHIVREIRESGNDKVRIPFGSDYSLKFKNQNSQKAVVNVEIDGEDVLDGDRLVVDVGVTTDLLGFMKDGTVYNSFRFIKKTQEVAEHRGDFIDDGYIRISWRYEKPNKTYRFRTPQRRWNNDYYENSRGFDNSTFSHSLDSSLGGEAGPQAMCNVSNLSFDKSDEGITVAGKETHQDFYTTHVGELETVEHVIVIHLLGQDKKTGNQFDRPKLAKTRITCPTCGKRSRSNAHYCPGCGTNLTAVV